MISGGLEVKQFVYIRLILEAKFVDNPLLKPSHIALLTFVSVVDF